MNILAWSLFFGALAAGSLVMLSLGARRGWSNKTKTGWAVAGVCSFVIALASFAAPAPTVDPNETAYMHGNPATKAPEATPEPPTPKPTTYAQYLQEQKHDDLLIADESITGAMIAGNKFKYVGKTVDLHCSVLNIPDASFFNASCGEDSDGLPVTIVVEHDSTDLSPGQAVRIIGPVDSPMEGNNAMGGNASFPTVKADFLE